MKYESVVLMKVTVEAETPELASKLWGTVQTHGFYRNPISLKPATDLDPAFTPVEV